MKAIVNTAPGQVSLQEWPRPTPGPGQVLIRTGTCGICATDIKMIAGWDRTSTPSIPGHEWAGTVAGVGTGVAAHLAGCRCVAENVLADGGEVGFEHPGGYGEYFLTEADKLHVLPPDFSLTAAALIEPLAVAVHGTERLRVQDTRSALILGDGAVGLLFLAVLRSAGIQDIVVVGGRSARLQLAEELGAANVLNYRDAGANLPAAIRQLDSRPFPNIVEASGSPAAMPAALELAAHGSHILLVGDHGDERAGFHWNSLLHQEIELIGSNASAGAWPQAVRLATSGQLPLQRLVSHRFPVDAFADAIDLTRGRRDDVVKVILEW